MGNGSGTRPQDTHTHTHTHVTASLVQLSVGKGGWITMGGGDLWIYLGNEGVGSGMGREGNMGQQLGNRDGMGSWRTWGNLVSPSFRRGDVGNERGR